MKGIFITGTDTGIGKTVISSLLMNFLKENNKKSVYLKIFQTGCNDVFHKDCDAYFVYKNLLKDVDRDFLEDKICYLLKNPKAPYFAALDEGIEIDISYTIKWIQDRKEKHDITICEGAGGLMVPITKDFLIIDLIDRLKYPVILVSRPSLGTINHTLLSIEALKNRNIPIKAVIFSLQSEVDREIMMENKRAIYDFSKVKVYIVEQITNIQRDVKKYYPVMKELVI